MIIGFAGKAASGKTSAAKHLLQQSTLKIEILPMAQMLREEVEDFIRQVGAEKYIPLVYGDQDDKVRVFHIDENRAIKNCPVWSGFVANHHEIQDQPGQSALTVRRILQWWGTEYRRTQDPDYWTKAWEKKLEEYELRTTHILVDDVRFINELKVIEKHGGTFIKIERPGFNGANNHSSENSLDDYDDWNLIIQNDGTLEAFESQVDAKVLPLLNRD
jgi:hypothetical protein